MQGERDKDKEMWIIRHYWVDPKGIPHVETDLDSGEFASGEQAEDACARLEFRFHQMDDVWYTEEKE